ncbi:MAG: glycosyltransferase family 4 protein [Bacteroidales bacterium]|nr:glycosyltransferase family 4 protein [Bacteroidales bacterium]
MQKKRIAVIGLKGLPAFGGAASVGENIIHELSKEFDFTVYSVSSHTSVRGFHNGFEQIVFRKFFIKRLNIFVYYLLSAIHCTLMRKFDLIHLHHVDGAFILPILHLKYKVILTSHAQPYVNDKWSKCVKFFFMINEWLALISANMLTAVSMPLAEIYRMKTNKPIHFIPNGIKLNPYIADTEIGSKDYILFAAGRIIPLKGLHILLESLRKGGISKKLVVIGDLNQMPAYRSNIMHLAENLNIEFIPLIRQKEVLLKYVQLAELFIFPSLSENMSVMLLEAASLKTPVLCSDIPANQAIFDDSEVLFFKANDSQDLLEKLFFAFNNPRILKRNAQAAFEKLTGKYQWETIARQYKEFYDSLIG